LSSSTGGQFSPEGMCAQLRRARMEFGTQLNFSMHFLPLIARIGAAFCHWSLRS
jgi:hypothetical protein